MQVLFQATGVYGRRLQWWFPWGVTRPWLPRAFLGGDEWCNDSVALVLPPLGCFVLFWRPGRLRVMPCAEDWELADAVERADYAPCGRYYDGKLQPRGHNHLEVQACREAAQWLLSEEPYRRIMESDKASWSLFKK